MQELQRFFICALLLWKEKPLDIRSLTMLDFIDQLGDSLIRRCLFYGILLAFWHPLYSSREFEMHFLLLCANLP